MPKIMLEAAGIRLSYGDRLLLCPDRLTVFEQDRIGLIGENGAGKSTLLRILAREQKPDEGVVRSFASTALIHQEGAGRPGDDPETRAVFRARETRDALSGGEMTRNRISEALSAHPALLMADEPTTDLDQEGQSVLRKQLLHFPGAMILVSHDRALLRLICNRIWYLEEGKITDFPGGLDAFTAERERRRERATTEWEQYRAEKKRLKESAQRMAEKASQVRKAPGRMGNSEARLHKREWTDSVLQLSHAKRTLQNRIDRLEVKAPPRALPDIRMQLGVTHPLEARYALEFRCTSLYADKLQLLEGAAFVLPTGSKTALLGPNGCGKTTLLRLLTGQESPAIRLDGSVRLNPAVRLGWFDQHHEKTLSMEKTVLENVLETSVHPEHFARTMLACLALSGDSVFKPLRVLSGGERAKTALARLLLMDCNTLLLDEPTNHLDLFTMEALENLLIGYGGTLLFVSHDAEFVRKTATRIVRFLNGTLKTFEGSPEEACRQESDRLEAEKKLEISRLEMRLAVLSSRMAQPRKGDQMETLQQEYLSLAARLREVKRQS